MTSDESEARGGPRWGWILGGTAFGLALLILGALVLQVRQGAEARSRAEAEIRASGEPLHGAEIGFEGPDASDATRACITRLTDALNAAPDVRAVLSGEASALAEARAWEPCRAAGAALEDYASICSAGPDDEFVSAWSLRLVDAASDPRQSPRDLLAIHLAHALSEPLWEPIAAVCRSERETGESGLRTPPEARLLLGLRVFPYVDTVRVGGFALPELLIDDRLAEALERWRVLWRGSQRIRGWPNQMGFCAWSLGTSEALHSWRLLLRWAPREMDLDGHEITDELRALDVHALLLRAWTGERALGNDLYDWLETEIGGGARTWLARGSLDADRGFYLATMTACLQAMRARELRDALPGLGTPDHDALRAHPTSCLVLADPQKLVSAALSLQATLRVAIVATTARCDGAEAGWRAARALEDPYDGLPLRARADADGTFVVWSIGADKLDQTGAPTPAAARSDDIVWKVRVP